MYWPVIENHKMRPVLLILIYFVSDQYAHLALVENLRNEFLELHNRISKKVGPRQNDGVLLLPEYKFYLDKFRKEEPSIIDYDFFEEHREYDGLKGKISKLSKKFKAFSNLVDKAAKNHVVLDPKAVTSYKNSDDSAQLLTTIRNATQSTKFLSDILQIKNTTILGNFSVLQLSFILYQQVTIVETKGLVLSSFRKLTSADRAELHITDYRRVLLSLENLPDDIWRRDPEEHIKNDTYLEVEKFLQTVVAYEKNLSPKGDCKNECSDFQNVTTVINRCDNSNCINGFLTYNIGELYNCREFGGRIDACRDERPRIYKYIKVNNRTYGTESNCDQNNLRTFNKSGKCSHCVCTMDYKGFSDKAISMRAAYSDVRANKVIIGAKFQRQNNITHIRVKEGILGPFLTITNDTRWVDIEDFRMDDRLIFRNQDFFVPTRFERSVQLADYKPQGGKKDSVLTGVRFYRRRGHLALQVRLTAFDLESGSLAKDGGTIWYDTVDTPSDEIEVRNPDLPVLSRPDWPSSDIVSAGNRQFVRLTQTSLESDFGQTTVPFLDAQEVVSKGPLRGLGIYYKRRRRRGDSDSGGFLGIRLLTYDFREHLETVGR